MKPSVPVVEFRRSRWARRRPVADRHGTDAATGEVVSLDYKKALSEGLDRRGNIREVRLRIPAGTALPGRVRVHVITDVFPLGTRTL